MNVKRRFKNNKQKGQTLKKQKKHKKEKKHNAKKKINIHLILSNTPLHN